MGDRDMSPWNALNLYNNHFNPFAFSETLPIKGGPQSSLSLQYVAQMILHSTERLSVRPVVVIRDILNLRQETIFQKLQRPFLRFYFGANIFEVKITEGNVGNWHKAGQRNSVSLGSKFLDKSWASDAFEYALFK